MSELISLERSQFYRDSRQCQNPYKRGHLPGPGIRCRRRDCTGCGWWWEHDHRDKILAGLRAYKGATTLTDLTPPGQDVLPYGPDGRCLEGPVRAWNKTAPERFRTLHRIATKRAKRRCKTWHVLVKVWQEQRRGALHAHMVLPWATVEEQEASREYVAALVEHHKAHGFGWPDRKLEARSPEKSAGYIGRYVAKELWRCKDLPGHVVDVCRHLTARSGVTVRTLRAGRVEYARRREREACRAVGVEPSQLGHRGRDHCAPAWFFEALAAANRGRWARINAPPSPRARPWYEEEPEPDLSEGPASRPPAS